MSLLNRCPRCCGLRLPPMTDRKTLDHFAVNQIRERNRLLEGALAKAERELTVARAERDHARMAFVTLVDAIRTQLPGEE